MSLVALSFIACLLGFAAIGMASALVKKDTSDDYLLAGRKIKPWMAALSAVATNNSGFMFVGLIGTTYTIGLSGAWLMIGWVVGDWMSWFIVHKRLRQFSKQRDINTFARLLGSMYHKEAPKDRPFLLRLVCDGRVVTSLAALITVIFLGTYAAAQLTAGSKALHVMFGWPYQTGAIVGAVIVLLYCYSGGLRASIWTDVAQSFVMIVSMALLLGIALIQLDGLSGLWSTLHALDPQLLTMTPNDAQLGPVLFILGWLFAGLGIIGQPHVMVRIMALDNANHMKRTRRIYISWYASFSVLAVLTGLCTRALMPDLANHDPELALPTLSMELLPPVLVGLVLAGLFAATMSTADSQVLSCSGALTQDLTPKSQRSYLLTKLGTLVVAIIVLLIALYGPQSVFTLVTLAWSVLASAFAPLLLVNLRGKTPPLWVALLMMAVGVSSVLIWRYGLELTNSVYDTMPGMLAGGLVFLLCWPFIQTQDWRKEDD